MDKENERRKLYSLMGDLPDRSRIVSAVKIQEEEHDSFILEKLSLDLNCIEDVPAYFIRPKKAQPSGPFPTILYNHAHGGDYELGKDELLLGRRALKQPSYAQVLSERGYAALCIDTWAFGERRGRSESEIFKEMLWTGRVMWGMMVYDSLKAVDYLASRPDVDPRRLGTMGISMGSTMAWWTAALDTRIKVCIDICCLTDYQALIENRGLDKHGVYYFVPGLLKHFSAAEINSLISPRPHLSLAGNFDSMTPPAGLNRIDNELKKVYEADGAVNAWKLMRYDTGHFETHAMRAEILSFIKKWL